MPEHREGTPEKFRVLESFLWHDFADGTPDWLVWNQRLWPEVPEAEVATSGETALQLHRALRSLQAHNNGIDSGAPDEAAALLNQLIATHGVRPAVGAEGQVALTTAAQGNPAARLLVLALQAMQLGVWRRFKVCRDATCGASYFDASKAAVKAWCSMDTCGSRNKMRRYRTRRLQEGT
ncbi:hypothetical protein GO986_02565 [Deinococcus sp. HMF7620]|uniref:Zinc finger CGNR domain-containing protein n=1 Tax=Deinococcus arboris TaxID=2682977 RepID=A0A7C9LP19_9DEIO|nr:CGNR zinc finger domain-containing protein [Deinococcus arboris]MVN85641.1 hypothetical protein [Deinococcus arboris]